MITLRRVREACLRGIGLGEDGIAALKDRLGTDL